MKIIHVITGMQKAAGTSVFCGEVANGLVAAGHEVTVAVVNPQRSNCYPLDPRIKLISIASLFKTNAQLPTTNYQQLPTNDQQLTTNHYALIHIHALWSPVLHKVAKWSRAQKIPIVWSPHGMLTPWAMNNKWLKKHLGWRLYQRWDLAKAALLHATAESEVEDIRRMGLKNDVMVAPLGVNVPRAVRSGQLLVRSGDGKRRVLFVSRVQRKKGLVNLAKAWAELPKDMRDGWRVRIVGPDQENHTAELKSLCAGLGISQDFDFVGPKYGDELQHEYASADIFVLPTHSENFGSVVIEALAHCVPVITTKGTPWHELEGYTNSQLTTHNSQLKSGWWIDIGVPPLVAALKDAMSLSDAERREMGERGRRLVEEKYTWDAVVKKMIEGYKRVVSR